MWSVSPHHSWMTMTPGPEPPGRRGQVAVGGATVAGEGDVLMRVVGHGLHPAVLRADGPAMGVRRTWSTKASGSSTATMPAASREARPCTVSQHSRASSSALAPTKVPASRQACTSATTCPKVHWRPWARVARVGVKPAMARPNITAKKAGSVRASAR